MAAFADTSLDLGRRSRHRFPPDANHQVSLWLRRTHFNELVSCYFFHKWSYYSRISLSAIDRPRFVERTRRAKADLAAEEDEVLFLDPEVFMRLAAW